MYQACIVPDVGSHSGSSISSSYMSSHMAPFHKTHPSYEITYLFKINTQYLHNRKYNYFLLLCKILFSLEPVTA